ncbi:MAG: hypothetical protein ACM3XM_01135, partial [Mycobacterium leprae]
TTTPTTTGTVCPPGFVCVPAAQAAAMQAITTPTITTPMVTTPTTAPTTPTTDMLNALLGQLGLPTTTTPTTAGMNLFPVLPGQNVTPTTTPTITPAITPTTTPVSGISPTSTPGQIFNNPIADLGALNPFAALAASNPTAALAALSPALNIFNPAINPNAALLSANPAAASTLALGGVGGPATLPFGKLPPFGKGFTGI